jgi:D-glycero-D-manno-heptose 1,7-bisphosphate phosphatase
LNVAPSQSSTLSKQFEYSKVKFCPGKKELNLDNSTTRRLQKFIFLDRDGTLIKLIPYLKNPAEVEVLDSSVRALNKLSPHYKFGIITNQSLVGRGIGNMSEVSSVNQRVRDLYAKSGINFEFIYVCPHLPESGCVCRKPEPYLGKLAMTRFKIDQDRSFMVGDSVSDFEFGVNLGVRSMLLEGNGLGGMSIPRFSDLDKVADLILSEEVNNGH